MNCRNTQDLMVAYLDEELSSSEQMLLEEHLECCPTCCRVRDATTRTRQRLTHFLHQEGDVIQPRAEECDRVAARLPTRGARSIRHFPAPAWRYALVLIVIALAIGLAIPAVRGGLALLLGLAPAEFVWFQSEHFQYRTLAGSAADQDRERIIQFCETVAQDLQRKFGSPYPAPTEISLFQGLQPSGSIESGPIVLTYEADHPEFNLRSNRLFSRYFYLSFGPPPDLPFTPMGYWNFLSGALASALDCQYAAGPPVHLWAAAFHRIGADVGIASLFHQTEGGLSGPVSSAPAISFVSFLLEHYPTERIVALWQQKAASSAEPLQTLDQSLLRAYGKSLDALEGEWITFLDQQPIQDDTLETARLLQQEGAIAADLQGAISAQTQPIDLPLSELPKLMESPNRWMYGLPPAPLGGSERQEYVQWLEQKQAVFARAREAVQLCQQGQILIRKEDWVGAQEAFRSLRSALVALGNESFVPWVDTELKRIEGNLPPSFPWWGWALIGAGAAGVLLAAIVLGFRQRRKQRAA
jgi:anti-sigma factor RsiW